MTIDALDTLADLRAVGLSLTPQGNSLRVRPSSKLTEARRRTVLDHKPELLAALEAERIASEAIQRAACRGGRERLDDRCTHPGASQQPTAGTYPRLPSPIRQAATPGPATEKNVDAATSRTTRSK